MKQDHLASSIGVFDHEMPQTARDMDRGIEGEFDNSPENNVKLEGKQ